MTVDQPLETAPGVEDSRAEGRRVALAIEVGATARVKPAEPLRTTADLVETSTSHTNESPGSSPSTVATDCGTVVFNDPEPDTARNALDSKFFGKSASSTEVRRSGHISGLTRGRRLDLILKYRQQYRSIDRPMAGTKGPWSEETEQRAIRLISSHRESVRPDGKVRFLVESSDPRKPYEVFVDADGWTCNCPSWADRKTPCKHIVATARWLDPNPPPIIQEVTSPTRPSYSQPDWAKYDEAQQLEHQLFDRLLWDLLGNVPERVCETGRRGRPTIPLRTQILVSTRKVHFCQSMRRVWGLLVVLNQDGKGMLARVPNYSAPSRFFNRPQAPGILVGLIEQSGAVLREIEDRGTVAIDSSGFCTTCRGAYCTEMHEPTRRHRWVKAHLAVGVKTHIVLSAVITDEHGGDSPQFGPLLRKVADAGHTPSMVVADKAYLSRENFAIAETLGIDPFIPFKSNSTGLSKGSRSPMWNRKFHEFMSKRDEFDEFYHQRSNAESAFSAIKRKLGEPLLSRTPLSRMSELLTKILAYNVGIVIQQSHLHGLEPGQLGVQLPKSRKPQIPTGGAS
jgi:transposase